MIVASLNCNKRLGNSKVLRSIRNWLEENEVDLFLAQEPWPDSRGSPITLPFYRALGGNSKVFAWMKEGYGIGQVQLIQPYWQQLKIGYLTLHNVYLSAYRRTERGNQLITMKENLAKFDDRPQVIVGDFNLAPSPEDGLSGESPSDFNGPADRGPFKDLLSSQDLIDATCKEVLGEQEFTVIRTIGGIQTRFRCDLGLISDYLFATDTVSSKYDHSVRKPSTGFTDHSALVLDLPITLAHKKEVFQGNLFSADDSDQVVEKFEYYPHKTAINRNSPSPAARLIGEEGLAVKLGGIRRILDYGCGRGKDIEYYRRKGFDAEGYDPYPPFGFATQPSGLFDLVTIIFVINVLSNCWERLQVMKKAAQYLRRSGYMLLVARSLKTIAREARIKEWKSHNDGYWSHQGRNTFQKGISSKEMTSIAKRVGLSPHPLTKEISLSSTTSHLLVLKK